VGEKSKRNGEASALELKEVVLRWKDRDYRITIDSILKAFDKAGVDWVTGPHARFFIDIGGDMKPLESVFKQLVPVDENDMNLEMAEQVSELFQSFGFVVLDRHRHHES
jgi:hypothetical protein